MAGGATAKKLGVRIFRSLVPYGQAQSLQTAIHCARKNAFVPDTLLILQHPSVVTVGKRAEVGLKSIKTDEATLKELKCDVFKSDRGGDVTYHGPGQLVAYPILDLKPNRKDLHRYLRDLETVLIGAAADYGIEAERDEAGTGVWTAAGKLAAIGIRVSSGWITSHGIALNVNTELQYFDTIVPCGISDRAVTSLERELGFSPPLSEVGDTLIRNFCTVFGHGYPDGQTVTS